jgi:hypothetical protein
MDIKEQIAKTIAAHVLTRYEPVFSIDFRELSSEIIEDILHLSDAQLLELQKEGAKLVVQCAEQDMPELYEENFSEGMTLPTISEMRMIKKGMYWLRDEAGFVKVVGG